MEVKSRENKKFKYSVKLLWHSTKFKTSTFGSKKWKKLSNCFVIVLNSKQTQLLNRNFFKGYLCNVQKPNPWLFLSFPWSELVGPFSFGQPSPFRYFFPVKQVHKQNMNPICERLPTGRGNIGNPNRNWQCCWFAAWMSPFHDLRNWGQCWPEKNYNFKNSDSENCKGKSPHRL